MSWRAVVDAGGELGHDLDRVDWSATPLGPPDRWPDSLLNVLRVVVSSRFAMWMAWGPQLTFFCNDAYRRDTLGTKYPWALGRPASEVWGEIWDDVGPRIASVLSTGVATWDESLRLFLERSGYREETYHTFSYSPLADESGSTVGMLCVVAEETERVIAERRLRTLRDVAADLAEAVTEDDVFQRLAATLDRDRADLPFTLTYLFGTDTDEQGARLVATTGLAAGQRRVLAGEAAIRGTGWPVPAPGGGPVAVAAERFPSALRRLLPELGQAVPGRAVVLPLRARPEVRPIGLLVAGLTPFRPLDDDILSFVGLLTDQVDAAVTTVRTLESARQRVEALAELDRVKSQFFANVSHELRTPLTLILGPLERIRDTITTTLPALAPDVETMHGNALRLSKLVTDVLDFSRLQAGRLLPAREPVDLAVVTRELAEMFRSAVEHAGLRYVVACDDVGLVTVDASMWERIVLNLLSNALKFTFEGEICVRLTGDGAVVRLAVEDTGAGIPDHELPRLFERFHRVERSRARSSEGSGIGLALVAELVALHGGQVEADSELDVGSTFTVTVPVAAPAPAGTGHDPAPGVGMGAVPVAAPVPAPGRPVSSLAPAAFLAEVARWTAGGGAAGGADRVAEGVPGPAPALSEPGLESEGTILVVDDNADMRAYVTRLLVPRFVVHTAVDGADAFDQIQARRPDLVVSDVMMPNVDGVELVRRIRSEPDLADLPVILLTAAASTAAAAEGFDVGADDYLVKPFTAENLLLRVTARIAAGHDRRRRMALGGLRGELGTATTPEQVLDVAETFLRGQLGADISGLALVDERNSTVRLWHVPGLRAGLGERYRSGTTASPAPAFVAIRTGDPVIVADRTEMAERFPEVRADLAAAGIQAAAVLPLRTATGVVRGSLAGYWSGPRVLAGHELDLLADAAGVVAEAVDRIATAAQEHRFLVEFQERLLEIDHRSTEAVVAVRYQPARNSLVGGDWFDVITLADGSVGITIGDVVGSGLPAATSMSQLRSAARLAAMAHPDPPEVLTMLDAFAARAPAAYCATALYARLQTDRVLRWSSAGHPPPLLIVGAEARFLDGGLRPLLGFGGHEPPEEVEAARSASVLLPPASTLLFYTDGMIERRGEVIDDGLQRLAAEAVAQRHLGLSQLADALIAAITPEDGLRDDVALIALRTVGARPELLVDAFRSDTAELAPARSRFRHWLEDDGTPPGWVDDLVLAFGEVIANAVEHGNGNDNRKVVGVEAARVHNRIEVSVTDAGSWLADSNSSQRRGRGRGFSIVNAIAGSVDVDPGRIGTTVSFTVDIPSVEPIAP